MVNIIPSNYGLACEFPAFRDRIATLWNDWKPVSPHRKDSLDDFFCRPTTHVLPFVLYVRSQLRVMDLPEFVILWTLLRSRKDGKAKVKPYTTSGKGRPTRRAGA